MKRKWSAGLSLMMAAAIGLAGCSNSGSNAPNGTDGGDKEKVLTFALARDSPANPPKGCSFHTRCPYAQERCVREMPDLQPYRDNHEVACHFPLRSSS